MSHKLSASCISPDDRLEIWVNDSVAVIDWCLHVNAWSRSAVSLRDEMSVSVVVNSCIMIVHCKRQRCINYVIMHYDDVSVC